MFVSQLYIEYVSKFVNTYTYINITLITKIADSWLFYYLHTTLEIVRFTGIEIRKQSVILSESHLRIEKNRS